LESSLKERKSERGSQMAKNSIVQAQQRWEYVYVVKRTDSALDKEFNELGQNGWELVSVICGKDRKGELAWTAFMKRPATQQPGTTSAGEQVVRASEQPSQKAEEAEPPASPKGFDLSGDEFAIREEKPETGEAEPTTDGSET